MFKIILQPLFVFPFDVVSRMAFAYNAIGHNSALLLIFTLWDGCKSLSYSWPLAGQYNYGV